MTEKLVALAVTLALAGPASAGQPTGQQGGRYDLAAAGLGVVTLGLGSVAVLREDHRAWAFEDYALESLVVGLLVLDTLTTMDIRNHPMNSHEWNPILGRGPSDRRVMLYMGSAALVHVAGAILLPKPWRTIWQAGLGSVELAVVAGNLNAGMSISIPF